jgi:hypothetical protein
MSSVSARSKQISSPICEPASARLGALKKAIDEFYENAFAPEIVKILSFVESSELTSKLIAKHMGGEAGVATKSKSEVRDTASIFQTNLLKIRQAFESALSAVKIDENVLLFIDGIDVRPADCAFRPF